jgi:hypothetical protein
MRWVLGEDQGEGKVRLKRTRIIQNNSDEVNWV